MLRKRHTSECSDLAARGSYWLWSLVTAMVFCHLIGIARAESEFDVRFEGNALASLKARRENAAECIQTNRSLGNVMVRWRAGDTNWLSVTDGDVGKLSVQSRFAVQDHTIVWTVQLQNLTGHEIEIGDLALPLPIARSGPNRSVLLKHGYVSGHGSFLFWMRSDNVGPHLVLVPSGNTSLEYWEASREGGYRVFIHSAAAGAEAKARGTKWRQPHTSLTLAPKGKPDDTRTYELRFRWANDLDEVRHILVEEGGIDVQVVPGMTVPNDLFAEFALRAKPRIKSIEAEFPADTRIESIGRKGDYQLHRIRFSRLGENRLTVRYGDDRHMYLEFFSTEPLETLVKKRGAFLARSQHRDPAKWYEGLITDWNMETQKLISPDDYAPIPRNRYYAVTCDDPGLGKPAFLAAKNAEFPVQAEVDALDYYITNFVWGGLQQTTAEPYPYAIYGIPDWKTNRESADTGRNGKRHLWRVYDYPHVIQMYFAMYRVAKDQSQIKTALTVREYLQRAYGTARAMFTVPFEIERWSAYGTGFYNELVIVDLIAELDATGMTDEANTLRGLWERKVKNFVNREQDLFRSEYAFDTTGFESTHALAKYAMQHADKPGETNFGASLASAGRFMEKQMTANLFCRGVIEPAYYYLGSDFRGSGGNSYTLTYMAQMGGWAVLDYALDFATNPPPLLRLGYASYLSAWALMNSGTPESNYGYWFPGKANDGGAGGGFEPAPFGRTWLGQPHHRGSWNFACEIDLGYCGALRTAATILADDPIFGRFCFGGDWKTAGDGIEVIPRDGLRKRFVALLGKEKVFVQLDAARFASQQPIKLQGDSSALSFTLESDNPQKHLAELRIRGLRAGDFVLKSDQETVEEFSAQTGKESVLKLPMDAGVSSKRFTIVAK
ncbi:MAG TPA: DUF5695 domain-containing protein [Verrucomicrobiae bacterium]|nr:DUF5695 domain-containing protein [Verrucomicrobiae bacterium]